MALSEKREAFCQKIAAGLSQYEAYLEAYPKSKTWKRPSVDAQAYNLMKNNEILNRISELKAIVEQKVTDEIAYGKVQCFEKLVAIQDLALNRKKTLLSGAKNADGTKDTIEIEEPDLTAALKAEELKGKLNGLFIDKKDVTHNINDDVADRLRSFLNED